MRRAVATLLFGVLLGTCASDAQGTSRYYEDVTACSPNGRYTVDAKSPDNKPGSKGKAFQADFVYTCSDTKAGRTLWTRKQRMGKPFFDRRLPSMAFARPEEGSPTAIFVSDSGWAVINTGWDELIAVDAGGRDRCRIKLLSEAITKEERDQYVVDTTAGPKWQGYSLWYFLHVEQRHLFVIRPWWGRRIVTDVEKGKLAEEVEAISKSASNHERDYVLAELARAVKTRKQWEGDEYCELIWHVLDAAYWAGRLKIPEAIPHLRILEGSPYSGSSTFGGLGTFERFEGEVNPHSYSTFTLRQVVQLSLRRLGEKPQPLPCNEFEIWYQNHEKDRPYTPTHLSVPRHANADRLKAEMRAEQVLDLVGAPDFVGYDTWEYDMDAEPPFSVILKWDVRHVIGVERKTPPLWQQGFARDKQVVR